MSQTYSSSPAAQDPAVRELATLLQLGRRAREAESVETIGFVAVNETRQLFEYRQAALGRVGGLGQLLPARGMGIDEPAVQLVLPHHSPGSLGPGTASYAGGLVVDQALGVPRLGLALKVHRIDIDSQCVSGSHDAKQCSRHFTPA